MCDAYFKEEFTMEKVEKDLVKDAVYFMLSDIRFGREPSEGTKAVLNRMGLNYFQVMRINEALVVMFSYYQLSMDDDGKINIVYVDPFGEPSDYLNNGAVYVNRF